MRRRHVIAIALSTLCVGGRAEAAGTDFYVDPRDGTIGVGAESSPVLRVGGRSGPVCSWVPLRLDRDPETEDFTEEDIPFSPAGHGPEVVFDTADGATLKLFRVTCPDGSVTERVVRIDVTVADLIPGVRDRASALVPLPAPAMNPAADVGGIVNVGLWLAVDEQVMPSLTAEAGLAWITVSPRLASTRYDFGNGDGVTCEGVGVPIEDVHPDLDVVEESPWCGYTYRRSSPDDAPYRLTVTTVWELAYVSSEGAGTIPSLERSVTVDYDVDEIQTVGVSN